MSSDVVFVRPIEKVGTVLDIMTTCDHAMFPVVDKFSAPVDFSVSAVPTTVLERILPPVMFPVAL